VTHTKRINRNLLR